MTPTLRKTPPPLPPGSRALLNLLARSFLRGLLIVTPAAATIYLVYVVFAAIDRLFPVPIPGLGLLIAVGLVIGVGLLAGNILTRHLIDLFDMVLTRTPLVRLVYTSIRDLIEAFVGDKKRFDKPVLVRPFGEKGALVLGFVTRTSLDALGLEDHVAVYLPQSYNFAGQLLLLPAAGVTPLEADSTAVMAFIVSAGVAGEEPRRAALPPRAPAGAGG